MTRQRRLSRTRAMQRLRKVRRELAMLRKERAEMKAALTEGFRRAVAEAMAEMP